MEECRKRGLGRLEPMVCSPLKEESSLFPHDSRDANDFELDLLDDCGDDGEYQPPEDELTLKEEEKLKDLEPFPSDEIIQLHAARHEMGHPQSSPPSSFDD